MKDYTKYSQNFKKLSLKDMDKDLNILQKAYEEFPKSLGTDVTLKVHIKLLS